MINRVIGSSALACFAVAGLLFASRLFDLVSPRSRAYYPVNWAFFWVFGLGIVLADIVVVRRSFPLMQARTPALRWLYSAGAFLALLIAGAVVFLTLCVGMNFMGQ